MHCRLFDWGWMSEPIWMGGHHVHPFIRRPRLAGTCVADCQFITKLLLVAPQVLLLWVWAYAGAP